MRGYVKRVSQKAGKLSIEQLRSLLDDMVSENENLYSILESLSAGLLIVDNNFILQQTNTLVESRLPFNIRTDDVKATSVPIWEILEDQDIARFFKNCKEKEITNCSDDFTTMTSGGTVRFLTITMTPLMHDGKLSGRIFLVMDITDTKNQEVILHRMENMANLTNLAAGMAHEIKNPLGAISIHIQLIQKALKKARENQDILPEKKFVEDHIDVVNEEIEHLNKLVMDFLLAVRPVKATLELKNPETIIQNTVEFITPEFNKSDIQIEFTQSSLNKKILIDEKLFRDVMMNLAQNSLAAIKSFRKSDGIFKIRCYIKDNRYIIETSDNGCGMDSETLSKIFEPYYTTKANGTGLGMTMVYKIIKEFSGEILVDSEKDMGTKFTLVFPLPQKDKKLLTSESE
ncbi:MAG: PAS domain S-box protein [Treponema sp.]|nr:PAS domain S-box protein [Treponema sp.]